MRRRTETSVLLVKTSVLAALGLGLLSLFGCASLRPQYWYLHNEANNRKMQKIQEDWSKFTDSNAGLWGTLLRNQEKISEAEILAQQALQEALQSTNHRLILSQTWQELQKKTKSIASELIREVGSLQPPSEENKKLLTQIQETIKKLEGQTVADKEKLNKAMLDRQRWQARLRLLERGTQELIVREASQRRGLEVKKSEDILNDIMNDKIIVNNADGVAQEKTLQELLKDDQDLVLAKLFIAPPQEKDWITLIKKSGMKESFWPLGEVPGWQLDDPPGIDYEIVVLGADLTRVELDRARAVEARLSKEINLIGTRQNEIEQTLRWAEIIICWFERMENPQSERENHSEREDPCPPVAVPNDAVRIPITQDILQSFNESLHVKAFPDTQGLIQTLEYYVIMDDTYTLQKDRYDVQLAALRHQYELQESTINARQREVLIQSGIDALSTYHAGGITQTEIAQILQAAQVVALAIITERL